MWPWKISGPSGPSQQSSSIDLRRRQSGERVHYEQRMCATGSVALLHVPAAHAEAPGVGLRRALRAELVAGEVGVVRGVDPVVREGASHVLADPAVRRRVEQLQGK